MEGWITHGIERRRRGGDGLPRAVRTLACGAIAAAVLLGIPAGAGADTGAPDPGGNENATLRLPTAGKSFGFNGLFNYTDLDSAVEAELVHRAGGRVARMPAAWWGMEPQRDVWDRAVWARHALAYDQFRAQGVTPHFVLRASPPWVRDAGDPRQCLEKSVCIYPPAREMLGEWEEFVAEFVRRFPAATVEVWNEPNSQGQWRTGVDPERYAELLAAADRAAAGVNPSTRVMMAGLGGSVGTGWMAMREFLDRAYAASPSLKGHTDAVNVHLYSGGKLGGGTTFAQWLADIRAVRSAHGDDATPIFVSETGATTTGPWAVTEAGQADVILRTVTKLLTMPDVSGVLVHSLMERGEVAADDPEGGYGVLRDGLVPPLVPKRAYCQLTRASASLYSLCPPLAIILSGPQGHSNQASSEFGFTATEGDATFECSLDDAPFSPCSSPTRYSGLAEGTHRFEVRAIGAAGRDPEPFAREFTLDVTPPETELWSYHSGSISNTTPVFHPSTPDTTARTECSLNGAAWTPCESPHRLGPLADGSYTIHARAIDRAGNVDPTPSSISFRVDTRAPVATITAGPSGRTANASPRFEFTADEQEATFRCAFNGNPFGPCKEAAAHYPGQLLDGSYSFQVMALDAAGNRSATVSRSFQIDRKGPAASIAGPPSPMNDATPTFELGSPEAGATFVCRFDDAPFAPCPAAVTAGTFSAGSHAIEARALDDLGNQGPISRLNFVVDLQPPQTSITSSIPALVDTTDLVIGFSSSEGGPLFQCSLDGAPFRDCGSPLTLTGLLGGGHRVQVRAIDRAGNVDPTPAAKSFTVAADLTPPSTSLDATKRISRRRMSFSFSADDSAAGFQCSLDRRGFRECTSAHRTGRLKRGRHVFRVRAIDPQGNTDDTPSKARFRIR